MADQVAVILQARTGSTRLPGKVLADLAGRPMMAFLVERLKRCNLVDRCILATTELAEDDVLAELGDSLGLTVVRGSRRDVLSRFILALEHTDAPLLVRITGDCPLVDPNLLEEMIHEFRGKDIDYLSNCIFPTYPDGLDIEIFTRKALLLAQAECDDDDQREHVTPWIRESGRCRLGEKRYHLDCSAMRWTVDEPEDLQVIRAVVAHFEGRSDFAWEQVLELSQQRPYLFEANVMFARNEGVSMGEGQKLWRRAKRVIPGGNMLLSKRAEMFLPDQWPAYFSRAKGCRVWDLDGRELIDMSIMGIGTNLLGYGHPEVDAAVAATVAAGNMSTLNCPEEVWLAERLVGLHPWAEMARFARSGGEANAIAIRIARAATGRDTVAICGYHGWHDWYLATNLQNTSGLEEHLLPGLEPNGVPSALAGTVQPFSFNRLDQLEAIASRFTLAAVKMEVQRTLPPDSGFLEGVRELCNRLGIVLIFDECTSGFRETFGGLHLKYGVEPDMAMFGKALGNGYAITATIGRRAVMEAAQTSFISSTFWTERIGPSAALKTLEVMERERSWELVTRIGEEIRKRTQALADKHSLKIEQWGIPALTGYTFQSPNALAYKTLITQEMLAKGYLAGNSVYVSTVHTPSILDAYFYALDPLFALIKQCEEGRDIMPLLTGPICHGGFKRLN
ncbi:MAG: aminotransferase class III-fold pyridoxal phosphate-dependent enzyme [Cyanobacteria bacterium K_DeepCast_35m_m2_023]|nr:aminotransferase class III-fold pyridoxal phosphate-dependent enzyme [Cyanobacteria bacterium K_DeepCast_35m_m2_023]